MLQVLDVSSAGGVTKKIAYLKTGVGRACAAGVIWLGGFRSQMTGDKATALAAWAQARGLDCLRFDYSGHGASSERFEDCTVGDWLAESLQVFRMLSEGPQVIVASSMGGWIALLMVRALQIHDPVAGQRIKGLALIAPAWDMTEDLIWRRAPEEARRALMEEGVWRRPSACDAAADPVTRRLIEEGRNHLIGGAPFSPGCPVRILHGMRDDVVPWERSLTLTALLQDEDLRLTLVKDGDHRLSRPQDLDLLFMTLTELRPA